MTSPLERYSYTMHGKMEDLAAEIRSLLAEVKVLRAENEKFREALEYYAKRDNYDVARGEAYKGHLSYSVIKDDIEDRNWPNFIAGRRARAALGLLDPISRGSQ